MDLLCSCSVLQLFFERWRYVLISLALQLSNNEIQLRIGKVK